MSIPLTKSAVAPIANAFPSTRRKPAFVVGAVTAGLLLTTCMAQAGPIQVVGDIITRVTSPSSTADGLDPSLSALGSYADTAALQGGTLGSAVGSADISPGLLRASASAYHLSDGTTTYSETYVDVTVADFITIGQSSGLPVGTPDTITLTMSLSGIHTAIDNATGGAYGMDVTASEKIIDEVSGNSTTIIFDLASGTGTLTGTFAGTVGEQVILDNILHLFTYANGVSPYSTSSADYSHTVNYYLDSSVAGVDFIGSTGHNYASPTVATTPEPLTLSLFGAGLAGAVAMRRRKKSAA